MRYGSRNLSPKKTKKNFALVFTLMVTRCAVAFFSRAGLLS
jgi:hypothetical protein